MYRNNKRIKEMLRAVKKLVEYKRRRGMGGVVGMGGYENIAISPHKQHSKNDFPRKRLLKNDF